MTDSGEKPILAVTVGDPAGIGPEIVARTLADPPSDVAARGLAVGDAPVLRRALEICGLDARVKAIETVSGAAFEPGTIDVLDQGVAGDDVEFGAVSAAAGRAAVAAIEAATRAALDGQVDAVVTAPINKEAIWAAGSQHLGHTEMLGELTGSSRYQTMFVVKGLKVFFTTRHMSLREALDNVTFDSVMTSIREAWTALQVLGHDEPRLAIAALNPHGGENGKFGKEEIEHIGPACDEGRYDGILSHFHDQGHIAAKTVDFEGAITVTMGLPIIRTSVDHGTAYDIAGRGVASAGGLAAAFRAAADFAPFAEAVRKEYGTVS
jgi:4-phospho-D-threonate 3-dehydrogenase / 4-phospho-D-erythronate 3-dehydrogenase